MVKIDTKGRDFILGGLIYRADKDGFVEVPKQQAIAEGHLKEPATDDQLPEDLVPPVGIQTQSPAPPNVPPAPWENKP